MNGDIAVEYIRACALTFVYSLSCEIFLFKIVKMNYFAAKKIAIIALSANIFPSDQVKDGYK